MPRFLPFASVYSAFHRRPRLSQDTPQNLDVVAVRSRAASGATMEAVAARERHLAAVEGFEADAALLGTAGHVLNRARRSIIV